MVHSQLPLLSLLCLLGALLLLPLQLTLGIPERFSQVPPKDEGLQKALAFTLPQYNQNRTENANYFKLQRVTARSKVCGSEDGRCFRGAGSLVGSLE